MSPYLKMSKRIRSTQIISELISIARKVDTLYEYGAYTVTEFSRLDGLIVDSHIQLTNRAQP